MQFEEVQIIHIRLAAKAKIDALGRLVASPTILLEGQSISVDIRMLLTPLLEGIQESKEAYNGEIVTKDWRTPFLEFLKHDTILDDLTKKAR